jgi:prevent-host-death family protein
MEEIGLEDARRQIGELVDLARFAGQHTAITRHGKPAAVIVGSVWYDAVVSLMRDQGIDAGPATGKEEKP